MSTSRTQIAGSEFAHVLQNKFGIVVDFEGMTTPRIDVYPSLMETAGQSTGTTEKVNAI